MAYLSELLGREVHDAKGTHIGRLGDVLISPEVNGDPYPRIVALAVRGASRAPTLLPWGGTEDLAGNKIILQRPSAVPYQITGHELFLNRDVMDKQVIDINGSRVVRVNDLELAKIGDDYRLVNVDIGLSGLLRRLGWEDTVEHFAERVHRAIPSRSIRFNDLEFVPRGDLKVSVARARLRELHPADIAEILGDMSPREVGQLIHDMPDEKAADVMEELEPKFQAEVLETLPDEKAADIVEEMEPDEAADALQGMEEDKRAQVFNLMEPDESATVSALLEHPEDTAGGLMTTKYVTVPSDLLIADAFQRVRQEAAAKEAERIYSVYVVDTDEHLVGVISLSDLVLAPPESRVSSIMHQKPKRARLTASHEDVLELIAKYNLLAVPVVDEENRLRGIVTADAALDLILPEELKIQLPRLF